jgi:chorismate dehydratase
MWDFEHPPRAAALSERYQLHYTSPSLCADELLAGRADLGLIPIASLTPDLAIVPNCAIASLDHVRSIQMIVKATDPDPERSLRQVATVASDTASRSSLAYAHILFQRFLSTQPEFLPRPADPLTMLQEADAALLIGDPALLALEHRSEIEEQAGPCHWFDLAHEWRARTSLPWVAAVWAVRPEALTPAHTSSAQLIDDLTSSRDHGLAHLEDLVTEWSPRIDLAPHTIRDYLSHNIYYRLDQECERTIELFRRYAAELNLLPALETLRFL